MSSSSISTNPIGDLSYPIVGGSCERTLARLVEVVVFGFRFPDLVPGRGGGEDSYYGYSYYSKYS